MSASPPSVPRDVNDAGEHSDNDTGNMADNPDSAGAGGYADFEVKEQDRWLPIANGTLFSVSSVYYPRRLRCRLPSRAAQDIERCDIKKWEKQSEFDTSVRLFALAWFAPQGPSPVHRRRSGRFR